MSSPALAWDERAVSQSTGTGSLALGEPPWRAPAPDDAGVLLRVKPDRRRAQAAIPSGGERRRPAADRHS